MSVDQGTTRDWTALLDAVAEVEEFERHGGLLVPAGTVVATPAASEPPPPVAPVEPAAVVEAPLSTEIVAVPMPVVVEPEFPQVDERPERSGGRRWRRDRAVESADTLRTRLTEDRELVDVQRVDERARRELQVDHEIALADVQELEAAAKRERRSRARDAEEADALDELYRRAALSGARARIRTQIQGSAEMRALRVAAVRKVTLLAGIPVLLAFATWSTTGVQAGVARLLDLESGSAAWWASWAMEPALIAVVALVIIGRAVLRSSGGGVDWRAHVAEWSALGMSLALNIFGGMHTDSGFWAGLGGALAHSIGPIGCAGVAFMIGVFDSYVSAARPWDDAPRLADLDIKPPSASAARTAIKRGKHDPAGADSTDLPDDVRTLLSDVRMAIVDGLLPANPSGYAIYKHVMHGRGDRARATKVAGLIAGWRPELRAV